MTSSATRSRHRWRVGLTIIVGLVGVPLVLFAGCAIAVPILDDRATDRLAETAQVLVAGTPYAGQPVDQLPGYHVSGSVIDVDNSMYLSFDMPAEYAQDVADNVTRAGWTVDIAGCLTDPDREGPPCAVLDEEGNYIALAGYWPGPGLFVMVGPG